MFRYVLPFILINFYYPSFGLPVNGDAAPTSIGKMLLALAQDCKNTDLSELIKSQSDRCNSTASVVTDLENCLMFYDINKQLCTRGFQDATLDKEQYSFKMNGPQNVTTVCKHAQTWNFTLIEDYPQYNPDKVFKDEVLCVKVCVDDNNITSIDSNFFCKYYMWGSEVLQNLSRTSESSVVNDDNIAKTTSKIDSSSTSDVKIEDKSPKINSTTIETTKDNIIVSKELSVQSTSTRQPVNQPLAPVSDQKAVVPVSTTHKQSVIQVNGIRKSSVPIQNEIDQPPIASSDNGMSDIETQDISNENEPQIDNPDINSKEDQDQDLKNNAQLTDEAYDEFSHKSDLGQKENIPPYTRQDTQDAFNDDDDHFFPFFLTGTVIVVLMYILYHNKSKVTKVVLGLIVEGRQSGKRRNSRGHAYRRLDTLEQAMSTNTAAPPSKIIY